MASAAFRSGAAAASSALVCRYLNRGWAAARLACIRCTCASGSARSRPGMALTSSIALAAPAHVDVPPFRGQRACPFQEMARHAGQGQYALHSCQWLTVLRAPLET